MAQPTEKPREPRPRRGGFDGRLRSEGVQAFSRLPARAAPVRRGVKRQTSWTTGRTRQWRMFLRMMRRPLPGAARSVADRGGVRPESETSAYPCCDAVPSGLPTHHLPKTTQEDAGEAPGPCSASSSGRSKPVRASQGPNRTGPGEACDVIREGGYAACASCASSTAWPRMSMATRISVTRWSVHLAASSIDCLAAVWLLRMVLWVSRPGWPGPRPSGWGPVGAGGVGLRLATQWANP